MSQRQKGSWSSDTYQTTASQVSHGPATARAERNVSEGRGLDRLVDPKTHDVKRQAFNLLVPQPNGTFLLEYGTAMPWTMIFDGTYSMGDNVDKCFRAQPSVQNLLVQGAHAPLARYHVQMANGIVQDRQNRFPFQLSEYEPDNERDRQMTLLAPERQGFDNTEDYQIALWYAAFRIETSIEKYGLKPYLIIVGDEIGREEMDASLIRRVFGISDHSYSSQELGRMICSKWHAFYLQVYETPYTTRWWTEVLGRERVVRLPINRRSNEPRTELMAQTQAVIAGLTEGTLDLNSAYSFLTEIARLESGVARDVVNSVREIPLRAQADLPNFGRIPMPGAVFATRDDLWPTGHEETHEKPATTKRINWL